MKIGTCALALTAVLAIAAPAIAHHGDSGVDMKTTVVYEGTVKEFAWKNPHVYFVMEMQRDGKTEKWEMQMAALSGLARRGWTATTLQPGDKVTVRFTLPAGAFATGVMHELMGPHPEVDTASDAMGAA